MTGEIRGRGRPRKTESTYTDTRNDLIRAGLNCSRRMVFFQRESMPLSKMPVFLKAHFITISRAKKSMPRLF